MINSSSRGGDGPVLQNFQRIQENTRCIFASRSRLWGAPQWASERTIEENVNHVVSDFCRFIEIAEKDRFDGYVIEVSNPEYGRNLEAVAAVTREILTCLSKADASGVHCMEREVEDPKWRFSFMGEELFVAVFAPCYGVNSSRHSFGIMSTMLLFQPSHAFDRAVLAGEERITDWVRNTIRSEFESNCQVYDLGITLSPFEAYRFIKPLRLGDPVVRWWDTAWRGIDCRDMGQTER